MPNRIIKETVCTSETIDQMTWFEECFYHRLWVHCDDYGRMDARPAILKAKLFPLKERMTLKDIEGALQKMVGIGCVTTYVSDGKPYLYLPSWEVHQSVRAKKSKYPEPEINCMQTQADDSKCPRNPIQSESNPNPYKASAPLTEFEKCFSDFKEMRKKIKAPMTARAETLILSELQKLAGDDESLKIAILNQSVERSWRGVFALKDMPTKPQEVKKPKLIINEQGQEETVFE